MAMKLCAAILMAALAIPDAASADFLGKVTAVVDGETFTMESESRRVRSESVASMLRSVANQAK